MSYDIGDLVALSATFTATDGVTPVDPATLTCAVTDPTGAVTTYTYGSSPGFTKASTGVYALQVDAEVAGSWLYRFLGTGTYQAAVEGTFLVAARGAVNLCTLADVRQFLQKDASETNQDAVITSLLPRATRAIQSYTERQFLPEYAVARTFEVQPREMLVNLAPYELRTITSVVLLPDTTLDSTAWRGWPTAGRDGTFLLLRLYLTATTVVAGQPYPFADQVTITGNWGMAAVPEDVKQCAIVTVATWMRQYVEAGGAQVFTGRDDIADADRPEFLPAPVRGALNHYRRRGFT